jgi:hypothetical protein
MLKSFASAYFYIHDQLGAALCEGFLTSRAPISIRNAIIHIDNLDKETRDYFTLSVTVSHNVWFQTRVTFASLKTGYNQSHHVSAHVVLVYSCIRDGPVVGIFSILGIVASPPGEITRRLDMERRHAIMCAIQVGGGGGRVLFPGRAQHISSLDGTNRTYKWTSAPIESIAFPGIAIKDEKTWARHVETHRDMCKLRLVPNLLSARRRRSSTTGGGEGEGGKEVDFDSNVTNNPIQVLPVVLTDPTDGHVNFKFYNRSPNYMSEVQIRWHEWLNFVPDKNQSHVLERAVSKDVTLLLTYVRPRGNTIIVQELVLKADNYHTSLFFAERLEPKSV